MNISFDLFFVYCFVYLRYKIITIGVLLYFSFLFFSFDNPIVFFLLLQRCFDDSDQWELKHTDTSSYLKFQASI